MPPCEVNMTYEPFSNEPEYIELNRAFVATMDFSRSDRLLDLACGTGLMIELALQRRPGLPVVGLDLSFESLQLAERRLNDRGGPGSQQVLLLQGTADRIPLPAASVHAVLMGNAIHMLPDRDRLLAEVARVLCPGGFFAFNSSFYAGTFAPDTERFYHEWIKQALHHITRQDQELKARGLPGLRRRRGTVGGAFSNTWLSRDEWADALARHGLHATRVHERSITLTQRSFETIGAYGGFAEVLLSGYPAREASLALQATVKPALDVFGTPVVSRYWLEMTAVRQPAEG